MKKVLVGLLVVLVLGAGLVVGIFLVQQNQVFNQKASSPTGTATVSISPAQASFLRNVANPVSISFNTNSLLISSVTIVLNYSSLSAKASNLQIDPSFVADGNWSCNKNIFATDSSNDQITITCTNSSTTGFSSTSDVLIGTFDLTATTVPLQNPLIISFDPQSSTMTQKSDGQDVLLTPSSTGSYTITDEISASASPNTSTTAPATTAPATTAPTDAPTTAPTAAPTSSSTASPASTNPPIPVTGFDTPTIIGGAAGVILLLISAAALIL